MLELFLDNQETLTLIDINMNNLTGPNLISQELEDNNFRLHHGKIQRMID